MRLRQLRSFITVCETGSISRAADKLHVAQPALGLQIRGLEEEFEALLLDRHARGVVVTAAGERVLVWARETLKSTQDVKQQLRTIAAGLSGNLTLGLTPSIATAFALPILAAVQSDLPNLRMHLTEALGHVLREWVHAGRVDLALVFDSSATASDPSQRLLTERLYYVTSGSQADIACGPIALADVLDQPLALPPRGDSLRQAVEDAAQARGLCLRIDYEVQSTGVILNLVRSGIASTVLPMPMARDGVRDGSLIARRIDADSLERHLRWLHAASPSEPATVAELRGLIERTLKSASGDPLLGEAYTFASVPASVGRA